MTAVWVDSFSILTSLNSVTEGTSDRKKSLDFSPKNSLKICLQLTLIYKMLCLAKIVKVMYVSDNKDVTYEIDSAVNTLHQLF